MSIDIDPELVKEIFGDVIVDAVVELGRSSVRLGTMIEWKKGDYIKIAKTSGEPVELTIHGKPIAVGEVMVLDDKFALRVTEILTEDQITDKRKAGLYDYR